MKVNWRGVPVSNIHVRPGKVLRSSKWLNSGTRSEISVVTSSTFMSYCMLQALAGGKKAGRKRETHFLVLPLVVPNLVYRQADAVSSFLASFCWAAGL